LAILLFIRIVLHRAAFSSFSGVLLSVLMLLVY